MQLFVQVPCLNEEASLGAVLDSIPRTILGIDEVVIVVIDDGSSDRTADVARSHGVDHIITHTRTMGLARSFKDGADFALAHGADILVNTDGDNQYPQERISDLIAPILHGAADLVVADRQTRQIEHFSTFKKNMQWLGSRVVSRAAGTRLPDAASGLRAYSRESLMQLNVITEFSYAMESIIQAGNKGLRIESVPVTTNETTRESRLFKSAWHHMAKSAAAILRSYLMFKPHVVLGVLGGLMMVGALIPIIRFLAYFFSGDPGGHIQSLVLGSALLVGALLCFALLVLADLQRTNRVLTEDLLERVKTVQYGAEAAGPLPSFVQRLDDTVRDAERFRSHN